MGETNTSFINRYRLYCIIRNYRLDTRYSVTISVLIYEMDTDMVGGYFIYFNTPFCMGNKRMYVYPRLSTFSSSLF